MKRAKSGRSRVRERAAGQPKKVGRPLIVQSPEEMDRLVEQYIAKCREEGAPVTLTGMILHLGLSSRQSLDRYGERPEFRDSIKRTKLLVERAYEERLHGNNPTGAIFALKNMGWSDRQEVETRGWLASIDVTRLTDDQLTRLRAGESPLSVLQPPVPTVRALPAGDGEAGSK